MPCSALIPFDEKTFAHRKLQKLVCDDVTKEAVLQHMGYSNPFAIPEFDSVTCKKPECFEQDHIMMYATLVQWTFEELSVFVYQPEYIHQLCENALTEDTENRKAELQRVRERFRENLSKFELHLFPVHSGAESEGEPAYLGTFSGARAD